MPSTRSVLRNLIGWNKGYAAKDCDYSSDHSISVSESLLERWEALAPGSPGGTKRIVVLVDESKEAKMALVWALSHVVKSHHKLILLHIIENRNATFKASSLWKNEENAEKHRERGFSFAKSLEAQCKAIRPEVQVEVFVIEGEKTSTVVKWTKKLITSLLVVGQKKPSMFDRVFPGMKEDLAEYCISNTECLTVGVRKRSRKFGGYIINSRDVKNFWLLA